MIVFSTMVALYSSLHGISRIALIVRCFSSI